MFQDISRFREDERSSFPEEKFRAEILFKAVELSGNGRLGEMKFSKSPGNSPKF
jgi:hypothetical protein